VVVVRSLYSVGSCCGGELRNGGMKGEEWTRWVRVRQWLRDEEDGANRPRASAWSWLSRLGAVRWLLGLYSDRCLAVEGKGLFRTGIDYTSHQERALDFSVARPAFQFLCRGHRACN